jgi:phosphoribosylpyrophosphate synthetase
MERVDEEGQIATAMSLARLLSAIPPLGEGPAKVLIYDIHALGERFYFGDNVIPMFESAIPLIIDKIKTAHKHENVAIAFPDEGAIKRFGNFFHEFETITCSKVREGNKRTVTVKDGDAAGRHVFIIDDLVQTGGTLIECKNALIKQGAEKVSAYVTHAIFPCDSWKRFTDPSDAKPFTHFYITDSCPGVAATLKDTKPFEVLPLAASISAFLRDIA